jgi:sigma-B regulation protein RsbU (phosphoserine phosphatase)
MIRALASVTTDLSELVRKTNDLYLIDAHDSSMFSTLWIGIYNPENQQLVYCSQGHPPAIFIRDRVLEELWTPGIALGTQKVDMISTKTMLLRKGDTLVLYTDGIIEAHDPDQELFGKKRFYELLLRKKTATAQQIADRILEDVQLFSQDAPQHDDMTLIVFCLSN